MSHEPLTVQQLAVARAVLDTLDVARRQVAAYRASSDQVLADLRTVCRNVLGVSVCASCEPVLRAALSDLGPLLTTAEESATARADAHAALGGETP